MAVGHWKDRRSLAWAVLAGGIECHPQHHANYAPRAQLDLHTARQVRTGYVDRRQPSSSSSPSHRFDPRKWFSRYRFKPYYSGLQTQDEGREYVSIAPEGLCSSDAICTDSVAYPCDSCS